MAKQSKGAGAKQPTQQQLMKKLPVWLTILWGIFVCTPMNFFWFLYAGIRVKTRKWWILGIVYAIPFLLRLIIPAPPSGSRDWIAGLGVLSWVAALVHSFVMRREYLMRKSVLQDAKMNKEQDMRKQLEEEYGIEKVEPLDLPSQSIEEVPKETRGRGKVIEQRVEADGQHPVEAKVGEQAPETAAASVASMTPPPVPQAPAPATELAEGQIVDLNTADAETIALLPGINMILGMRAVSEREARGGFKSVEDFVQAIGLKPHVAERIRPYVTLSEPSTTQPGASRGRVVDI